MQTFEVQTVSFFPDRFDVPFTCIKEKVYRVENTGSDSSESEETYKAFLRSDKKRMFLVEMRHPVHSYPYDAERFEVSVEIQHPEGDFMVHQEVYAHLGWNFFENHTNTNDKIVQRLQQCILHLLEDLSLLLGEEPFLEDK